MKIELLSPAKDISVARSAILSGADAIYIGGSSFGARSSVSNSMDDIKKVVDFAHMFDVKVYMTMNTLLYDNELRDAEKMVCEAYNAQVDALIIQDLGFLRMDLPPIELHASTQTTNNSLERVQFLQSLGFKRVVLERALSLAEIKHIAAHTTVELEAFIHGSICVGYSGLCTLSGALASRGGNRGNCAQSCRSNYNLMDMEGHSLVKNRALLSICDLSLGDDIKGLIDARVCSLKIEGRLKSASYVVNNTAYYHNILKGLGVVRASKGDVTIGFEPNPKKSFSRSSSSYYFEGFNKNVHSATKSMGELLGLVSSIDRGGNYIVLGDNSISLNNGDGLCWKDSSGSVLGSNINRVVDNSMLYLNNTQGLRVGVSVYRNYDKMFSPENLVDRRLNVILELSDGLIVLRYVDTISREFSLRYDDVYDSANNEQVSINNIKNSLAKSGYSVYRVVDIVINFARVPFIPISKINELRRRLFEGAMLDLLQSYVPRFRETRGLDKDTISRDFSFMGFDLECNISNKLSKSFYDSIGFSSLVLGTAQELSDDYKGKCVMRSRYCIRREFNMCSVNRELGEGLVNSESLVLENNGKRLEARFDCVRCEMSLYYLG